MPPPHLCCRLGFWSRACLGKGAHTGPRTEHTGEVGVRRPRSPAMYLWAQHTLLQTNICLDCQHQDTYQHMLELPSKLKAKAGTRSHATPGLGQGAASGREYGRGWPGRGKYTGPCAATRTKTDPQACCSFGLHSRLRAQGKLLTCTCMHGMSSSSQKQAARERGQAGMLCGTPWRAASPHHQLRVQQRCASHKGPRRASKGAPSPNAQEVLEESPLNNRYLKEHKALGGAQSWEQGHWLSRGLGRPGAPLHSSVAGTGWRLVLSRLSNRCQVLV